ncbi:MAG: CGNR zinc finger domain-containing protein [Aestuariivirga sp.]
MHSWVKYGFFGGQVSLDFVNTVDDEGKTREVNAIPDWKTVLTWALKAGILSAKEAHSLTQSVNEARIADELDQLYAFRERLWSVLRNFAAGRAVDTEKARAISNTIQWAVQKASIVQDVQAFRWSVFQTELGISLIRARLALAVSDLITGQDLRQLRECGRCTGLFLHHGRGLGRRWCRMNTCGNRAKIERFRSKSE